MRAGTRRCAPLGWWSGRDASHIAQLAVVVPFSAPKGLGEAAVVQGCQPSAKYSHCFISLVLFISEFIYQGHVWCSVKASAPKSERHPSIC